MTSQPNVLHIHKLSQALALFVCHVDMGLGQIARSVCAGIQTEVFGIILGKITKCCLLCSSLSLGI